MTHLEKWQAFPKLTELIKSVESDLKAIGPQPVVIEYKGPNRHWLRGEEIERKIRFDTYYWEQEQTFGWEGSTEPGYLYQNAKLPIIDVGIHDHRLKSNSLELAISLLDHLESNNWRILMGQSLQPHDIFDQVALMYQFDQVWLLFAGNIYALTSDGMMYFSRARYYIDHIKDISNFVRCWDIQTEVIQALSYTARQQFCPFTASTSAAIRLRDILIDTASSIRAETDDSIAIHLPMRISQAGMSFYLNGIQFSNEEFRSITNRIESGQPFNIENYRRYRDTRFKKMNEVLNKLNFGPVRDFVKEAFEIEIFDEEEIFIFFAPLGIYLYHEGKLFSVHATETSDLDKNGEIAPINFIGYASYTALGIGTQNPFSGFDFSDPTHLVPKPF